MSEMIERVAIEMRRNRFKRTRRSVFDETVPPTENELDDARAALEAMRNPDKSMIHAACKALSPGRRPTPERVSVKEKHRIRFNAMIDAALGKPSE